MKSLTEAQLRALLLEAWEEGGWVFMDYEGWKGRPDKPTEQVIKEREEFFQKLIDGV